jgi:lipopolysaccharide biosynthesis protein
VSVSEAPQPKARAIAYYLPQFHPIPENDQWWGPGFTEWTNTARAKPLFRGHDQPRIPTDLGFYDLRVAETREAQAALARRHGVEAFCYWHYWFAGRRILERPYQEMLASGQPDFPFCLAWANQTWSGVWHGAPDQILIEQTYPGREDYERHFRHILPALQDPRYVTVDAKPLFYVFRPEQLPSAAEFVDAWQDLARQAGLPGLYLVAEESDLLGQGSVYPTAVQDGFDASVYVRLPAVLNRESVLRMRLRRKFLGQPERYDHSPSALIPGRVSGDDTVHPCIYPNWDNTPRSGRRGLAITNSCPDVFQAHVREALTSLADRAPEHRLLFVKSWNEWAEGNYLEPDQTTGSGYLTALGAEILD